MSKDRETAKKYLQQASPLLLPSTIIYNEFKTIDAKPSVEFPTHLFIVCHLLETKMIMEDLAFLVLVRGAGDEGMITLGFAQFYQMANFL